MTLPTSNESVWYALYSDLSSLHDCDQIHYVSLYYKKLGLLPLAKKKKKTPKRSIESASHLPTQ